ncbi:MAG: serine/threonine protein phosphatase [Candidatus Bathyarchaeota archaeon]|nr:serine/threonine protein phosphatase [Candidatus Bathyarchaeota archaeon]
MQKTPNINTLVQESQHANDKEFLLLVKHAISLLDQERKNRKVSADMGIRRISPRGEVVVIGDLHGDLQCLETIIQKSGFIEKAKERKRIYLIFLGDYGDRGFLSPEVYYVVLKLKEMFPSRVVLLRGNHEGPGDLMPSPHDLPMQLVDRFGSKATAKIYLQLRNLFGKLYNAAIVEGQLAFIHAGLPSKAASIEDIEFAGKKHPAESHLEEMLWSDPMEESNGVEDSPRGAGRLFGEDVSDRILKLLDVKILIRGHQFYDEGYHISHHGKVLTLFSTNKPPYQNKHAAYLQINLAEKHETAEQLVNKIVKIS